MLNQAEMSLALVNHANLIENAVLDIIEECDFRTYGLLEDLVSECNLHLLAVALPKFERGGLYGPALCHFIETTVRNKTINLLARFEHSRADMYADFDAMESPVPAPSVAAERSLEAARFAKALATLCPNSQAMAKQLIAGKSQKQAAKALKMSAPTASRRCKALAAELSLALA